MLLPQLPQIKLDGVFQSQIKRIGDEGMANGNFEQAGHAMLHYVSLLMTSY